eukprot:tig00020704_g13199.t1
MLRSVANRVGRAACRTGASCSGLARPRIAALANVHVRHYNKPAVDDSANRDDYVPLPPPERDGNRAVPKHIAELGDKILSLSIIDMADLKDYVARKLGLPTDMPMMMGGMGAAPAAAAPAAAAPAAAAAPPKEEKTEFDIKLESFDAAKKIGVIKEIRGITSLGLKEAKELVESAPKVIKKGVKKDEADKIMKVLVDAGAKIVLE